MKPYILAAASALIFCLGACANDSDDAEQPLAPATHPVVDYSVIKKLAGRPAEGDLTRLIGWDRDYYYFDWSQQKTSIFRGIGRAERVAFDSENRGGLTLSKGLLTVDGGQVRNLEFR